MANEALQIYMAEMNEDMRNLYLAGYSMPKTSEAVLKRRTNMLCEEFGDKLGFELKDFYELEIASGGIMRSYVTVPCDMYFTMERKVKRFLETTFLIYRLPDEKIQEATEFVSRFDFGIIAQQTIENMLKFLQSKV